MLRERAIRFVVEMGVFDESHGEGHIRRVAEMAVELAKKIIEGGDNKIIEGIDNSESIEIVEIAGLLHDICDRKYIRDKERVLVRLREEFREYKYIEEVIKIVTNISFTRERIYGKPEMGRLTVVWECVSAGDKYDALDFYRCLEYKRHKCPEMSKEETMRKAIWYYTEVIMKYYPKMMYIPEATKLALIKIEEVRDEIKELEMKYGKDKEVEGVS